MINKKHERLYWIIAVLSFFITRIFNPIDIKLGDYHRYVDPPDWYAQKSPEEIMRIIYYFGSNIFIFEIIFSFMIFLFIFYNIIQVYKKSNSVPIITKLIILFNPVYLVYLSFPSKEVIILFLMIVFYNFIQKEKNFVFFIIALLSLIMIFLIRDLYIIPLLYLLFLKTGMGRFQFFAATLVFSLVYYYFTSDLFIWILGELTGYFSGYLTANTTRWWVNITDFESPIELTKYFLLGFYTVFFGGLPNEIINSPQLLPIFIIGFFKLSLIYYILFKQEIDYYLFRRYLIFLALVFFILTPLSIFNIGSAMRYQVPFFIFITLLYGDKFLLMYKKSLK